MVGAELREARERQNASLGRVADRTKIPIPILSAIEAEDFASVPGGLFRRGFLRAYAKEVGLDPEQTVQRYITEFEPPPAPDLQAADVADEAAGDITAPEMEHLERRMVHSQWVGSAVVVLVGAIVYGALARQSPGQAAGALPGPGTGGPPDHIGTATSVAAVVPVTAVAREWPSALHVEILPGGPCWIAATSDGRQAIQRLMNAGEREILDANDEATLRVGDAAACAFSINGAAARPAGPAGQPVTLRITKQNYRQFVNQVPAPRLTMAPSTFKRGPDSSRAQPPAPAEEPGSPSPGPERPAPGVSAPDPASPAVEGAGAQPAPSAASGTPDAPP